MSRIAKQFRGGVIRAARFRVPFFASLRAAIRERGNPSPSAAVQRQIWSAGDGLLRQAKGLSRNDASLFVVIFAVLCTAPAFAAPTLPPEFCQALIKHVPSADVTYQPDPNVELNPSPIQLPEVLTIPITADLMQFMKLDPTKMPAKALGENNIPLGTVSYKAGELFWNGQPLGADAQDNLSVLCMQPKE